MDVEEIKRSGIIKLKGDNISSVWRKTSCCNSNSDYLREIANIADKYDKGFVHFNILDAPEISA